MVQPCSSSCRLSATTTQSPGCSCGWSRPGVWIRACRSRRCVPPPHLQAGRGGRDHAGDLHRGRGHDAAGLVPRHHPGLGQRATVLHRRQEPAGAEETQRGGLGGHGGGVRYEGGVAEHDTRRNPRSRAGRVRRGREPSWIRSPPLQNVLVWRADGTAASVPLSEKATGGRVVKIPDVFYFPGV